MKQDKSQNAGYGAEELRDLSREELIAIVLMCQEKIQELQNGRIRLTSRNSSRPPSSDLGGAARPKRPPTGRARGGQRGHPGHQRPLAPEAQVKEVVPLKPESCQYCEQELSGEDRFPGRHQVWDLPRVQPEITEYRLHTLICPKCRRTTKALLPPGVTNSPFAPRVQALVGLLTGAYRLSKRQAASLLQDLMGIPASLGAISRCEAAVSGALAQPVAEARSHVQAAAVLHVDETSWREINRKAWLWVAVAPLVTVFLLAKNRSSPIARELLGAFRGVLVSDRFGAYEYFPGLRQTCWAHLKRWFVWISEHEGAGKKIGALLVKDTDLMFSWWRRIRDGTLSRWTVRRRMRPVRRRIEKRLRQGAACAQRSVARKCRKILQALPHFWTFLEQEGVEPTNNAAEQALRHAVIWRKCCYGTQSEKGSRFVERVLTVVATCRRQERDVWQFLTEACIAYRQQSIMPSLLPRSRRAKRLAA
jgi:transposase